MKIGALIFLVLVGCGKNPYNSSVSDALRYGSSVSGTATFTAARLVMMSSCFACHGSWSSYTEADFLSKGLVVFRSLTDSTLFTRIRGNSSGLVGDMPQNSTLSSEDMITIRTWISNM